MKHESFWDRKKTYKNCLKETIKLAPLGLDGNLPRRVLRTEGIRSKRKAQNEITYCDL